MIDASFPASQPGAAAGAHIKGLQAAAFRGSEFETAMQKKAGITTLRRL
jgi:hypothetical protein